MRYLIGIDAAKAKNDIAIFNSDMGLVRKPFTVSPNIILGPEIMATSHDLILSLFKLYNGVVMV